MIQSGLLVLLIVVVVSAVVSWRARRQLLLRIRSQWGRPRDRQRDMEAISDFFRSHDETFAALDDRSWRVFEQAAGSGRDRILWNPQAQRNSRSSVIRF